MSTTPLTEAKAAAIIAAPKRIRGDIHWRYEPEHDQYWAKFSAPVENELGDSLEVRGNVSYAISGKSSFSLMLNREFRVFALDVKGSHGNKHTNREEWRSRTHKQRWTDQCRNTYAFTPAELIPEEPNEAFQEFCRECNIDFSGNIGPLPPFQPALRGQ